MEENRRQTDKRMDNLEKDIRELRADLKETHDVVTSIREKMNNGMTDAIKTNKQNIEEIKNDIKRIAEWMGKTEPVISKTPEQRLSDCPFKRELVGVFKRKVNWWLFIVFFFLLLTNNISAILSFLKVHIGG